MIEFDRNHLPEITEAEMLEGLNAFTAAVHENAVAHGWWDEEREFGTIIALCHSELSEALEEYRSGKPQLYFTCKMDGVNDDDECADDAKDCAFRTGEEMCEKAKPEGIAVELADCIIRILDYCGRARIDIENALLVKHKYNKSREYRHGSKKC